MRSLIVLALFAVVLATQIKGTTYKSFIASTYCKKNQSICSACYNAKFESSTCSAAFINFVTFAKKADNKMFMLTPYCFKNKDLCTKCMNMSFLKTTCTKAKAALLTLYAGASESKATTAASNTATSSFKAPALKEGLAQQAMAFFKPVSVKKGKAVVSLGTTGISLYDGLPWEPAGKAYELDNDKLNKYEDNILAQKVHFSMAADNHCSAKGIKYDGVVASDFAALPILAFRDINDAGVPIDWSTSKRPRKVVAILKKKADGKLFYLPCTCVGDAKGHAWPGGLAQTFLSSDKQKKNAWKFNSDRGTITGPIIGKTVSSLKDIRNGYSKVKYLKSKVSVQLNLELNSAVKKHLKDYTLAGFISWKE